MPTENRSSNTEQMVSVPLKLADSIERTWRQNGQWNMETNQEIARGVDELRAILAQTVAPHQGRPTGLSQGWNLTRQSDGFVIGHSSQEPEAHHKAQALKDGRVYVPFMVEQHQGEPVGWTYEGGKEFTACPDHAHDLRAEGIELSPVYRHPPASDGFSAEQMAAQGADGYRNGIKAAAELAADYPELAQAIRDLPLPQ